MRALIWKEFRQHRAVLIAGIVLVAGTPGLVALFNGLDRRSIAVEGITQATAFAFLVVVWPVLAAVMGSASIAGEHEARTLHFLLSRPISRARTWAGKVLVAAAISGGVALVSVLVVELLSRILPSAYPGAETATIFLDVRLGWVGSGTLAMFSALLFACAVLCSTILPRPLTAAAASIALALSLVALLLIRPIGAAGLSPRDGSLVLGLAGLTVVLLLASRAIFVHYRKA